MSSSKATTPIKGLLHRGLMLAVTGSICFALTGCSAAESQTAASQGGPSFLETFDTLNTQRWYVSDGWLNGDLQGCTWSRDNVRIVRGVLDLRLEARANSLRPYTCAEIKTNARYGYGTYEANIRTAAGSGLNTAIFTYSGQPLTPVHDEVDFEFLGRNPRAVQLNYFANGKGGHETAQNLSFDASAGFNAYAFVWHPGVMRWYVNRRLVREVRDAAGPVTPGQFFLSLWNGTAVVDGWLGPFSPSSVPAHAQIDWIAFTRMGESCKFRGSLTCQIKN